MEWGVILFVAVCAAVSEAIFYWCSKEDGILRSIIAILIMVFGMTMVCGSVGDLFRISAGNGILGILAAIIEFMLAWGLSERFSN